MRENAVSRTGSCWIKEIKKGGHGLQDHDRLETAGRPEFGTLIVCRPVRAAVIGRCGPTLYLIA